MTYTTLNDYNITGIHGIFLYVADINPFFIPLILFATFMIVLLGTYFSQMRLKGNGDFFASFAVAGYLTIISAFVLNLIPNLVNLLTLAVCIVVSVVGTILLLISRDR